MFSGIVKIADIDDYINPAQDCIKGLLEDNNPNNKKEESTPNYEIQLNEKKKRKNREINTDNVNKETIKLNNLSNNTTKVDFSNTIFNQTNIIEDKAIDNLNTGILTEKTCKKTENNNKKVKLTLNDCLACNGCVTTAETMLIEQHSTEEFLNKALSGNYSVIVTICPQSLVSLAHHYEISIEECIEELKKVLIKANVKAILNYQDGIELSLNKEYLEFQEKILIKKQKHLITSECPGWICYAEKKVGEWIIPYLSNIKSPQQILGKLIKHFGEYIVDDEGMKIFDKPIYFCSIMPCFDKKLESSRMENRFFDENILVEDRIKEVDNVLSTLELEDLFSKLVGDFKTNKSSDIFGKKSEESSLLGISLIKMINKLYEASTLDKCIDQNSNLKIIISSIIDQDIYPYFFKSEYSSSNGYSMYIIERIIKDYLGNDSSKYTIANNRVKNSDFREITLKILENNYSNNMILPKEIKFALIYGFRNIQKAIKKDKFLEYEYLEIMSCPGGCLNGGAQYRTKSESITNREMLGEIELKIKNNLKTTEKMHYKDLDLIDKTISNFSQSSNSKDFLKTDFKAIQESIKKMLNW
jgi:iron only hydrogenase large subunit-like protein